jgi:superkiller protein 3
MMGIVVLVALLLGRFSVQIRKTVGIVLVLVLCVMTFAQTSVWADTESLSAYVVKTSPQARLGHMWHGNSLRDAGDIDGALHEYGIALSFSEDPQVYYNRALAYEAGGDVGAATADYQKAISLDPHYALAYINLGRVLYLEGKKPEARLQFEKAMESAPSLAMPYYDLGVLEGETKNWEKAASFYRQALDRDPLLTDARANLAIALLQLGKTDEAIIELNRTLADDPTNPTALGLQEELLRRKIIR